MGQFELTPELQKLSKVTFKWIVLWWIVGAFINFCVEPFGFNYINRPYVLTSVYIASALALIWHYKAFSLLPHHRPIVIQSIEAITATLAIIGLGLMCNIFFPITPEVIQKLSNRGAGFPLFYWSTWLAKLGDIIFQQVFIFIFLRQISSLHLKRRFVLSWFTAFFFVIHLPLLLFLGARGWYFIIPSVVGGLIFSALILQNRKGLAASYSVHLGFYFLLGLYFRYY